MATLFRAPQEVDRMVNMQQPIDKAGQLALAELHNPSKLQRPPGTTPDCADTQPVPVLYHLGKSTTPTEKKQAPLPQRPSTSPSAPAPAAASRNESLTMPDRRPLT